VEHVRDRGRLPRLPAPLDFYAVPLVRPLVAAFGLVCEIAKQRESSATLAQRKSYLLDNGTGTRGLTPIGQFPKKGILFMRRRSTSVVVLPNTNDSAIDARMK